MTASRHALRVLAAAALLAAAAIPAHAQAAAPRDEPDTQPVLVTRNLPQLTNRAYPRHLRAHPIPAAVGVRMKILENGHVDSTTISIASTTDTGFDAAAMQVARQLRFRPATADGQPVQVCVTYPINFTAWTDGTSTITKRLDNP